mmetsp:Transcript_2258/g.3124  ORF Transcript_2258/g.3124 Transcript_2258/m.3124 type:complete len:892 (+) Transcript_2258:89-2764(+)|eukprot:CAMPEP_0117753728 /NCGR_PEP_ID=MMETSP0947-20121206/12404_1 /TAXON_ID=44440 /ORGANISM="Chattonella subsalsa, Strain CCMP2191" /LENGTH=891 /DNA_ID=CAMNT_0005572677 /DNA_START=25 /DNA_END=2700 /DNA_ORIENTATION=-
MKRSRQSKREVKDAKSPPKPKPKVLASDPVIIENITDEEDISGIPNIMKYAILGLICVMAFFIRLFAVVRYESVIHEFDPYFNFRTTKYLASEGFLDFLDWFDDRGWYPLGRTIGGTIYPGLMLTAATIHWALNAINITINIRNMCVFLAPLFAANTAISSYLLTTEVTGRSSTGLLAAAFTAIVPSYISRSVGGSYDNEGVAIFALIFVFYLWVKAVNTGSMLWGALTALAYFYMVAAWGGYVFIINIIPIHCVILIFGGRYSSRLYVAYTTFYTIGSLCAMQVPFVGFNVVKQAECAASHGVFVLVQVYAVINWLVRAVDAKVLKQLVVTAAFLFVGTVAMLLISMQLFGYIQWTGRSLTLLDPTYATKYIPIIASVSEHQPTTWTSFFFDLHILVPLAPVGLFFLFNNVTDASIFVIIYGTLAWYFAGVMVRLLLTLAPIACILAAVGMSRVLQKFSGILAYDSASAASSGDKKSSKKGAPAQTSRSMATLVLGGCGLLLCFYGYHSTYVSSMAYSSPSIVIDAGRTPDGGRVLYDDYREAYFWLRQNTDPMAKILSWWDYGYQMSAMANRTVLVDNNTWNNTHIATVGRALASSEKDAYPILESLDVDYVLVIFGGLTGYSSDDINKFLWPVRIGSGVYPDDMPSERDFMNAQGQFDVGPQASQTFKECLAYKCCYYRFGEVQTDFQKPPGFDRARGREVGDKNIVLETLEEAFTSEHWIVRIYKVKKRPQLDPTDAGQKEIKQKMRASRSIPEEPKGPEPEYVGCFSDENMFKDRIYAGGATGANFNLMRHHAESVGLPYFVLARAGEDGHGFAFAELAPGVNPNGDMQGGGCDRPCPDDPSKVCGCTDLACQGPRAPGQEHNRRWVVYKIPDSGASKGKKSKKKN